MKLLEMLNESQRYSRQECYMMKEKYSRQNYHLKKCWMKSVYDRNITKNNVQGRDITICMNEKGSTVQAEISFAILNERYIYSTKNDLQCLSNF